MTARMTVDYRPAEGAVLRMLGLVERRGFAVRGIAMDESAGLPRAALTLDVAPRDPGRSLDVLALQLGRLHGVLGVSHSAPVVQARGEAA